MRNGMQTAVQTDGLPAEDAVHERLGLAAADGVYSGGQFLGLKRFDNIVVCAGVQSADAVVQSVFCRNEDNAALIVVFWVASHYFADFNAVEFRQHPVQNNCIISVKFAV